MLPYVSGEVRLTSPYGVRVHPITNQRSTHAGVDLVGTTDKRIRAVKGGIVLQSRCVCDYQNNPTAEWGNYVAIHTPEDGLTRYYCHLDCRLVNVGDTVNRGDHIGVEGQSGLRADGTPSVTGPHLHYEVRDSQGNVNAATDLELPNRVGQYLQPNYRKKVHLRCGLSDRTMEKVTAAAEPYAEDFWRKLYEQMV